MQLLLLGLNYKTAALDIRGRFAFCDLEKRRFLAALKERGAKEALILSTCNRTEIYALGENLDTLRLTVLQTLSEFKETPVDTLEDIVYTYYNKFASVHLFNVAAGTDSMVFGENEILKQVKEAVSLSSEGQFLGPVLYQLFNYAIQAGKRVRSETNITRGVASVGALAARTIKEKATPGSRVLLLGVGQIGEVVLNHLSGEGFELTLMNRTAQKAYDMAQKSCPEASVLPYNMLQEALKDADVVIAATAARHYLITLDPRWPQGKERLFIDLSVPRNIDPLIGEVDRFTYYDMDHLEREVHISQQEKKACLNQVESILADEMSRFLQWFNTREVVPVIQALYQSFDDIRGREIERGLKKYNGEASDEIKALLERVTRAVTQKILHYPVVGLRAEKSPEKRQAYSESLNDLFKLDVQDEIDRYIHRDKSSGRKTEKVSKSAKAETKRYGETSSQRPATEK